jgi:RNA polymerase sigma-32 factor
MENLTETPMGRYMAQVRALPSISREDEIELFCRWRDRGDQVAKNELVHSHLRIVVFMALKYRAYGLPLAELIADGNLGLLQAIDKFDPERGMRFMTYAAYWIRAAILSAIVRSWSLVSPASESFRKMFFKLRREKARITNLVGDDPVALALLAERFGTSQERIAEMLGRLESRDVSLNTYAADYGSTELIDTLADPNPDQEQAYAVCEDEYQSQQILLAALRSLDPRERLLIQQRFMVDSEEEVSLAEWGRRMGVGRERARQLQERAKKKLRQHLSLLSNERTSYSDLHGSAA